MRKAVIGAGRTERKTSHPQLKLFRISNIGHSHLSPTWFRTAGRTANSCCFPHRIWGTLSSGRSGPEAAGSGTADLDMADSGRARFEYAGCRARHSSILRGGDLRGVGAGDVRRLRDARQRFL